MNAVWNGAGEESEPAGVGINELWEREGDWIYADQKYKVEEVQTSTKKGGKGIRNCLTKGFLLFGGNLVGRTRKEFQKKLTAMAVQTRKLTLGGLVRKKPSRGKWGRPRCGGGREAAP